MFLKRLKKILLYSLPILIGGIIGAPLPYITNVTFTIDETNLVSSSLALAALYIGAASSGVGFRYENYSIKFHTTLLFKKNIQGSIFTACLSAFAFSAAYASIFIAGKTAYKIFNPASNNSRVGETKEKQKPSNIDISNIDMITIKDHRVYGVMECTQERNL